eukprot:2004768-Amphidinium_carterae.1
MIAKILGSGDVTSGSSDPVNCRTRADHTFSQESTSSITSIFGSWSFEKVGNAVMGRMATVKGKPPSSRQKRRLAGRRGRRDAPCSLSRFPLTLQL